jgi:hypothetical protein
MPHPDLLFLLYLNFAPAKIRTKGFGTALQSVQRSGLGVSAFQRFSVSAFQRSALSSQLLGFLRDEGHAS